MRSPHLALCLATLLAIAAGVSFTGRAHAAVTTEALKADVCKGTMTISYSDANDILRNLEDDFSARASGAQFVLARMHYLVLEKAIAKSRQTLANLDQAEELIKPDVLVNSHDQVSDHKTLTIHAKPQLGSVGPTGFIEFRIGAYYGPGVTYRYQTRHN